MPMVRVDPKLLSSRSPISRAPFYLSLTLLIFLAVGFPSLKALKVGLNFNIDKQRATEEVVVIALNQPAPARGIFGTLVALFADGNRRILFKQIPVGTSRGNVATFRMNTSDKETIQGLVTDGARFEFFPAPVDLNHEIDTQIEESLNPPL